MTEWEVGESQQSSTSVLLIADKLTAGTALAADSCVRSLRPRPANQLIHRDSADFNSFFFFCFIYIARWPVISSQSSSRESAWQTKQKNFPLVWCCIGWVDWKTGTNHSQRALCCRHQAVDLRLLIRKKMYEWGEKERWWCKCWKNMELFSVVNISRDEWDVVAVISSAKRTSECQMLTELIYIVEVDRCDAMLFFFYFVCASSSFSNGGN